MELTVFGLVGLFCFVLMCFFSSVCILVISSHLTGMCFKYIPFMEKDSENP